MRCTSCDGKLSKTAQFCHNCGTKVVHHHVEQPTEVKEVAAAHVPRKRKWVKWGIIAGVILTVLLGVGALIVFALPISYEAVEEYTEKVPYTGKEYYTETQPYESTESYQDTEQYTDKECEDVAITKNVKWGETQSSCVDTACTSYRSVCVRKNWLGNCVEYQDVCQSETCTRYNVICNLVVKNLDNAGGTFSFEGLYVTKDSAQHYVKSQSKYLQPGDEESFTWSYVVDRSNWGYCSQRNFVSPKKTECDNVIKSRTVTKTRPVTEYRDAQKSREVTRYKDVVRTRKVTRTTTLYDMWAGKTQYRFKESD